MSEQIRSDLVNKITLASAIAAGSFLVPSTEVVADDHPGDCEPLGFHNAIGNDWTMEQTDTGLEITVPEDDNHCAIEVSMASFEQLESDAKFPQRLLRDEILVYWVGGEGTHVLNWPDTGNCEVQNDALVTGGVSNAINPDDPKYNLIDENTLPITGFVSWNVTETEGSKAYVWYSEKCEEPTTSTTTQLPTTTVTTSQPISTKPSSKPNPITPVVAEPNFTG